MRNDIDVVLACANETASLVGLGGRLELLLRIDGLEGLGVPQATQD